jgi:hypothetical protein
MGGLGNQMFQYAAGRALAIRHRTALNLDLSFMQGDQQGNTYRAFMLDRLKIVAEIASPSELPPLETDQDRSLLTSIKRGLARRFDRRRRWKVLCEFDNRINSSYFSAPDNSYLVGYWQSEEYFKDVSVLIRNELLPPESTGTRNLELAVLIGATNAVSIHVRRGDYVHDPVINAVHGVCSVEYYQRCVEEVAKLVRNPHFFLFSDEPGWARDHLEIPFPLTIIDHNTPDRPVEDLRLMSLCRHNIIANSSFSWWGAWLNSHPGKMVFAPKRWFACKDGIPEGLIPGEWTRF